MSNMQDVQDILVYVGQMDLDEESRDFLYYHFQHYEFLFREIDHLIEKLMGDYFYNGSRVHQLYTKITSWLPANLRQGITLITRKL